MALPQIKMLETLAQQLHEQLRLHGVKAALKFVQDFLVPARRNCTWVDRKKLLHLFMDVCKKMNLYSSAYVTCAAYKQVAGYYYLSTLLTKMDNTSAERFLEFALKENNWEYAKKLLRKKPRMQAVPVLKALIHHSNPGPNVLFVKQELLKRVMNKHTLAELVDSSIKVGDWSQFESIVKVTKISLSEVISVVQTDQNANRYIGVLRNSILSLKEVSPRGSRENEERNLGSDQNNSLSMSELITIPDVSRFGFAAPVLSMIMESFDLHCHTVGKELKSILKTAIETGLSTYHAALTAQFPPKKVKSPLKLAAYQGNLTIVRLLYRTGAATNAELRDCLDDLGKATDDGISKGIHRYIRCAAQQPRRLTDLCLLRVSHTLGCCSPVDRRLAASKIPSEAEGQVEEASGGSSEKFPLKERVLFRDVLMDFESGTANRAKDSDPPGYDSDVESVPSGDKDL